MESLMSLQNLAKAFQVKEKTLYIWVAKDKYHLKSEHLFKVGNLWRIDTEGFKNLVAEMKAGRVSYGNSNINSVHLKGQEA